MAPWKRTNFERLRDASPADLPMRWRFARGASGATEVGVSRFTFEPGVRFPHGHRHNEQEEVYVVVAGSGRAKLDDEVIEVEQWDVVRVAPEVMRAFESGPEGMELLCIGGRKPAGGDTVRDEAFWPGVPASERHDGAASGT